MTRAAWFVASALPGLALVIAFLNLMTWFPAQAAWFVREDGLVEWVQVAMAAAGVALAGVAAWRRFVPGDVLYAAFLLELAVAEVDLDRQIFGIPVIDTKFLLGSRAPLAPRVLAGIVIVGTVVALLTYAGLHLRELLAEARDERRQVSGPLFVVGVLLFAVPQPCERCLNVGPFPAYFLEELCELLGTLYMVLAMVGRVAVRAPVSCPADVTASRPACRR